MEEPLDIASNYRINNHFQANSVWIGLVFTALLCAAYAVFTVRMSPVFTSMSNSIHANGTVLISDGNWLRIWAWSALAPIIIPTLITLIHYRYKSVQVKYFELVRHGWLVSFVGMLFISAVGLFLFKTGSFIPGLSKKVEVLLIGIAAALVALLLSLFLSIFFIKAKPNK